MLERHRIPRRSGNVTVSEADEDHQTETLSDIVRPTHFPLENHFMAGRAKEVQAGDVNVVRGWETQMANCSRAIVTKVQVSAV
jgi:hypothetical protein